MTLTHEDEEDRQRAKAQDWIGDDGKEATLRLLPHFKAIAAVTGLGAVFSCFDSFSDEWTDFDSQLIYDMWPEMSDFRDKWRERCANLRAERIAADYALSQVPCEPLPRFLIRPPYAEPEQRAELAWGDALKLAALVVICTGVALFMVKMFAS